MDCHDADSRKGGLSMESLLREPVAGDAMEVWTRIHDRMVSREMPPPGRTGLADRDRDAATQWARTVLHESSLRAQRAEGRAPLRRLNAREYENTLRDLLGISAELQKLLPEDALTGGFDRVSHGLQVSSEHLVRYQIAADRAIAAAMAPVPQPLVRRQTARDWWRSWFPEGREDQRQSSDLHLYYSARLEGESAVFCEQSESNGFLEMKFGEPPVPGRYRLRAAVAARHTGGKPLPVLIFRVGIPREFNVNNARVVAVREAPAGEATVIEEEIEVTDDPHLGAGRSLALKGWSLPGQKHPDDLRRDRVAGRPPDFQRPALLVNWVELEGPLEAGSGYRTLFRGLPRGSDGEPVSTEALADAERLIRGFLPLAFRRPVDGDNAAEFVKFAHDRLQRGYAFGEAMRAAYRNILCSVPFLLFQEKPGELDDFALAARLSYFLWSSCPDEQLSKQAHAGTLRNEDVLRTEVERMLQDPRADRFIQSFASQWLDLRKLHMTKPDTRYVEHDDHLLWSMPRETTAFLHEMLRHDRPVAELVASDWTYLDARLARHYGVPDVVSWELQKVPLPPTVHRGGVITQAAVLKVTANGTTTSPVLRGKWLMEKIVGRPPAPPPPDIPALEPDIRGASTIREQLEKHRSLPTCAGCHVQIDPPGFALENFDVIGGWRDWYRAGQDGQGGLERVALANYPELEVWRGLPVESGYTMADGRSFRDIDEYRLLLLEDSEQIARNVAGKLLVYATGCELQFADREVIEQILRTTRDQQHGFRSILLALIQSRCFRNR